MVFRRREAQPLICPFFLLRARMAVSDIMEQILIPEKLLTFTICKTILKIILLCDLNL